MYLATAFFGLLTGLPGDRPDQLHLDDLYQRLGHRVFIAVPALAHRDRDPPVSEQGLIVDRAALRSAAGMMNQPWRGVPTHQSMVQRFNCKVSLQAITHSPTEREPLMRQFKHDG